jgi:uncharacterized protein (DUF1697 family)
MKAYVLLLRGINVGGKNVLSMAALKKCLEHMGFLNVSTYIASGNVILQSNEPPIEIERKVSMALSKNFKLDTKSIRVLALDRKRLQVVITKRPKGFGEQPQKYHSDAIFLIDIKTKEALKVFSPKEGIDMIWPGARVIYSQRLSALRTKSHLSKIVGTPAYRSMTIRTWNTVQKLLQLLEDLEKRK